MKNFVFTAFIVSTFYLTSYSQVPGGVSGVTFWLKADVGLTPATGNITSWVSQGSVASTITQGTAARRPLFRNGSGAAAPIGSSDNMFNYSPYLYFDGGDYLNSTATSNFGSAGDGITQFGVFYKTDGIVLFDWKGANGSIKAKVDGRQILANGLVTAGVGSQFDTPNDNLPKIVHLSGVSTSLNRSAAGATSYCGYNHVTGTTAVAGTNPHGRTSDKISVGSNMNDSETMTGGIGEIIVYNRVLSKTEMLEVNSYLAIKYGITLGGAGSVTDYLNSNGAVIWDSRADYHNDVIGIGRDNSSTAGALGSGLLQKQSHTDDDSVRIYIGTLATTNSGNSTAFGSDRSFVMMGSNNGKLCATNASNAEIPAPTAGCDIFSRLGREWLVQRSNMSEAFSIDIKLAGCAAPGSVNITDLRLLVDDDGDFSSGTTNCFANGASGLTFTYASGLLRVSGIATAHIPNNVARYITIASVNPATPLPVELLVFDAALGTDKRTADIWWTTETEKNSSHFDVQKLSQETEWVTFATVPAAGNSQTQKHYTAVDLKLNQGANYYRLKQVDLDGNFSYSDIRIVTLTPGNELLIFPNPANMQVTLFLDRISKEELSLTDETGRNIPAELSVINSNTVQLNTAALANGIYFITIRGRISQTHRFIINH